MKPNQFPTIDFLISDGLNYLKYRFDFLLLSSLPLLVLALVEYLNNDVSPISNEPKYILLLGLVSLIALLFNFLIIGAGLYTVIRSKEERVSIKDGLSWSKANIIKIAWLYCLSSLAILGGLTLFLIPGLIIALYVYFSQYVYVSEGLEGIEALRRSHDLVKGNWWKLFKVLLKIGLAVILVLIFLGITAGLLKKIFSFLPMFDLFILLGTQVFSAAFTLFGFTVGNNLYQSLLAAKIESSETGVATAKWKYQVLIVLGLIGAILLTSVIVFAVKNRFLEQYNNQEIESSRGAKVRMQDLRLNPKAEDFEVNS